MKRLLALSVLAGSLVIGVSNVAATETFASHLYRSSSSCSTGATDTSGARYGTFAVTESSGDHVVSASVSTDNLFPFRTYNVSIFEFGHLCILMQNVTQFTTDSGGHAIVHFSFWAHTGETSAWVWIQHGAINDIVKSTALPINR
jgi:hypothetical protein